MTLISHSDDLTISDKPQNPVNRSDLCGAQLNFFNSSADSRITAGGITHVNYIADAVLIFHDDEHTRKKVRNQRLRPKTQRHAQDAGSCDQWREIKAQLSQDHQRGNCVDDQCDDVAEERTQRLRTLRGPLSRDDLRRRRITAAFRGLQLFLDVPIYQTSDPTDNESSEKYRTDND